MSFKFYLENYCAELDGDFSKHKKNILDFFDEFKDISQYTIGRHDAFVVDLLMHNKHYHELYKILKLMFEDAKINIKFEEISHLFRIVFLQIKPNDVLYPHTDHRLRCQCCINIPLTNNCAIDFYEKPNVKIDATDYNNFNKIDTLNYTNPIILNTNSWHGVRNNTDQNRLILKVNFPITPWKMLIDSCNSKEQLKLWDTDMPWEQEKVQEQLL
jgi:hypothetical protein